MQLTKHWAATLDDYVIDLAWSPSVAGVGDPGPPATPNPGSASPATSLLAAASAAGPVSLFSLADGTRLHQLPGHGSGTNALAWQPPNRPLADAQGPGAGSLALPVLATGGQDGTVKFWDAAAGQHTATATLGSAWVEHLAWRGAGTLPALLFAASGRTLHALRPDAGLAHTFKPAPKTISALAAQPAGGSMAAAYFGGVCLWDTDDFITQKEFAYGNGIHALVWSPDSKWLVSGNQDPSVHLWIPEQDIELHMSGYEGKVKFLSFDHTSRWLATSGGRDACIWDCTGAGPEGREPAMLPHDQPVCAVTFQHTHGLLATGARDGTVQLWSPERLQPLRATVRMPSAATKFAWSPDDCYLAIGTERGAVYVLSCTA